MDILYGADSGMKTMTLQEKFSMKFELANFDMNDTYLTYPDGVVPDNVTIKRKISFSQRNSENRIIGQSFNIPSAWYVNVRCRECHMVVGLVLDSYFKDGTEVHQDRNFFLLCKFNISIVDKDGDILYTKKWKSSEVPRKMRLDEEHSMGNFMHLEYLAENEGFLLPHQTLRICCDGVLYSPFLHQNVPQPWGQVNLTKGPSSFSLRLRENMELTDIQLSGAPPLFGSEEIVLAHKLILKDASEYWNNLICLVKEHQECVSPEGLGFDKLRLDDLSSREVKQMVQYIYTGTVDQDWTDLAKVSRLIEMSNTYELSGLKQLCFRKVMEFMTLSRFSGVVLSFQKYLKDSYFLRMLNQFLLENQSKLIQMEGFQRFVEANKYAFLSILFYKGN